MEKLTREKLMELLDSRRDEKYRLFQAPLIPNIAPDYFIGVRTPELKKLAKEISGKYDCSPFLESLPHGTFDENQLHGFIICGQKDFGACIEMVENFLPYVNNWATCDQLRPVVFKKNKEKLLPRIKKWLCSKETYTVRFTVGMLMAHFLDESFKAEYLESVAALCRPHIENGDDNYYVNMMVSWYFATALTKQWDAAVPYIENHVLNEWCHKKAIQKSRESFRVTADHKEYLKSIL